MIEETLSMAQKLELTRTAIARGLALGYEQAGEKTSPARQTIEFPRAEFTTTEVSGGEASTDPFEPLPEFGGNSTTAFSHPFQLLTRVNPDTDALEYKVEVGSITDGTNGVALVIGDLATWQTASAGFVVINMLVNASLAVSLAGVTITSDPKEVVFNIDGDEQEEANLLIGKLTLAGDTYVAAQACLTSQICTHGILNGLGVRVFESAPTHIDEL